MCLDYTEDWLPLILKPANHIWVLRFVVIAFRDNAGRGGEGQGAATDKARVTFNAVCKCLRKPMGIFRYQLQFRVQEGRSFLPVNTFSINQRSEMGEKLTSLRDTDFSMREASRDLFKMLRSSNQSSRLFRKKLSILFSIGVSSACASFTAQK